jgi:hypothetical protein
MEMISPGSYSTNWDQSLGSDWWFHDAMEDMTGGCGNLQTLTAKVRVRDSAGNVSEYSATQDIRYEPIPTITLISPVQNQSASTNPTLTWSFGGPEGVLDEYEYIYVLISKKPTLKNEVVDQKIYLPVNSFTVPSDLLEPGKTYFWQIWLHKPDQAIGYSWDFIRSDVANFVVAEGLDDSGDEPNRDQPGTSGDEPAAPSSGGDSGITIDNRSSEDICTIGIVPSDSQGWGSDWLSDGQKLKSGQSIAFDLPMGNYDVALVDCDGNQIYDHTGDLVITQDQREILTFDDSFIVLQIENFSFDTLCRLNVKPPGSNQYYRKVFNIPIGPGMGAHQTFNDGAGYYDIELVDCQGQSHTRENSVYISDQYIVKALPSDGSQSPKIDQSNTSTTIYLKESLVQYVINEQFRLIMAEMKDYVEFKSTPEIIFEDGAISVRGDVSVQGAPAVSGLIDVYLVVDSAGVVQIQDVKVNMAGVDIPVDSIQEVQTMLNDAFQAMFEEIFVDKGVKKLIIDDGVMIVETLPVCSSGNAGSGNCIPADMFNEFISGIETLTGLQVEIELPSVCVDIPDVEGMTYSTASNTLRNLGFTSFGYRSDPAGIIVNQNPKPGDCYQNPEQVSVTLTEIPIDKPGCQNIPNFVGGRYDAVEDWSQANGFNFTHDYDPYQPDQSPKVVLRQKPPAGFCIHSNDAFMFVWLNPLSGD